ncbi:MAG: autotransporter-associated beta strand repeat-containing protein, partial [Opitutales bacterium]
AADLVINGGTLQYVGPAASTDRLFTIGPNGATLDGSGSGAIDFSNTSDLAFSSSNYSAVLTLTGNNTGGAAGNNTLAATITDNSPGNLTKVVVAGSGVWALTGSNSYSGGTAVNSGEIQLGATNALGTGNLTVGAPGKVDLNGFSLTLSGLSGAGTIDSSSSGTMLITLTNSGNATFSGSINNTVGTVGLVKSGTGTETFSGNNSFSGPVTLSGPIVISGGTFGSATSNFEVGDGIIMSGNVISVTAGTLYADNFSLADLANSTGDSVSITGSGQATIAGTTVIGTGLNTAGSFTINTTSGTVNLGAVNMGKDSTGQNGGTGLIITNGTVIATSVSTANGTAARASDVNINGGSFTIGNSSSSGAFEIGAGVGNGFLTMTGGNLSYLGTDGLLLSPTGAGATNTANVTISGGTATFTGVTLNAQNSAAVISNFTLGGNATLYIGSVGLVANLPSATVAYSFGTATVGATTAWTSSAPIGLTGTTSFQAADASSVAHNISLTGTLSGGGGLIKTGLGGLTLSALDTYAGPTLVSAGTLNLTSGLTASSVTVNSGALLATGPSTTISQNVTLQAGGQLATGGTGSSLLTIGNLTWNTNGTAGIFMALSDSGSASDALLITGNLIGGTGAGVGQFVFNFEKTGFFGGVYTLIDSAGANSGLNSSDFAAVNVVNNYGGVFDFNNSTGELTFTINAVPEPATWTLLLGSGTLLYALRRKRSKSQ